MTLVSLERHDDPVVLSGRRTRLSASARQRLLDSVPKETFKAYTREWGKFLKWCELREINPLRVSSDDLTNWVSERCDAGNSISIIEQDSLTILRAMVAYLERHEREDAELADSSAA